MRTVSRSSQFLGTSLESLSHENESLSSRSNAPQILQKKIKGQESSTETTSLNEHNKV